MNFEDTLAEIQAAVDSGQMSARDGVALAQKKRQEFDAANQAPVATYAGSGLGGVAGALLKKANPLLGGVIGSAAGGFAGSLIDGPEKLKNFDLEDAIATGITGAAGYGLGKQLGPALAKAPMLGKIGNANSLGEAAGHGLGTAAGLGTQLMTNDPVGPDESMLKAPVDLAGMGLGAVGGGIAGRALAGAAPGPLKNTATALGSLLGAGAGDAGATALTGNDRTMTPAAMGTAGGALLGGLSKGLPGALVGGLAGGLAGKLGGDAVGAGIPAAGLAAANPTVRSALAGLASKFDRSGPIEGEFTRIAGALGGPAAGGASASAGAEAGAKAAGLGAKMKEGMKAAADKLKTPFGAVSKARAKEAEGLWAAAAAAHPEHFAAMGPEADVMKAALAKDAEFVKWFKGRYGV